MKKGRLLLAFAALLALLAGCGEETEEQTPPQDEETVLQVEHLAVEIPKNGMDAQRLMETAAALPDQLIAALADHGVEVGTVSISIGAAPTTSAQAVAEGGVDVVFVPADAFVEAGDGAVPILASGEQCADRDGTDIALWNGGGDASYTVGTQSLLCTGPSEYGENLAEKAAGDTGMTWAELERARWGVLEEASLPGYRAVDLWLADHYEGHRLSDLPDVTVYQGYEALLRAAAAGEIDVFPLRADVREDWAQAWTLEPTRTDDTGASGLGRPASIWEEVQVVGVTERFYTWVVAAAPEAEELADGPFAAALQAALADLRQQEPELAEVFGELPYTPIQNGDLDPLRRLLTLEA